jgi:hypothetical protein
MNSTDLYGGFWPTSQQELLLQATLLRGKKALDAWLQWKASVDLDQLDSGSLRLLPLLHRNLRQHGVKDPLMGKLKGIHHMTWYRNHRLLRNMASVVSFLQDIGLPTMVLKGVALILLHYRDHGLRPVGDVDVLVPTKDAFAATDLLMGSGWSSDKLKSPGLLTETYLAQRHAVVLTDAAGQQFDLHWHVLADSCGAEADQEFWEGALEVKLDGVSTHALNPTDQLLHVCAHGARWASPPGFQWAADAMIVLRTAEPEIDWSRLLSQVRKHRLVLPLRSTLAYLRDALDASVPSEVMRSLQVMPVTELERLEYEARISPWAARGPWGELRFDYLRYSLLMQVAGLPPRLAGFPGFLMRTWGLEHLWQLPLSAVRRTAHRVRKMSGWYASGLGNRSLQR